MSRDQGGQYICQKEGTLVFKRIVPCCPHRVPVVSSLATFTVVISLDHRFILPACLTIWDARCFWSPPFSVVSEIFLSAWGSKTRFGFSDFAPGGVAGVVRTDVFWRFVAQVLSTPASAYLEFTVSLEIPFFGYI